MSKKAVLVGDPVPVNLHGKALDFVLAMAKGADYETAGKAAGLSEKSARQYQYRYREVINELAADRINEGLAVGMHTLITIAKSGNSESARVAAAKDLLDRCPDPNLMRRVGVDIKTSSDDALKTFLVEALGSEDAVLKFMELVRPSALTQKAALEHSPA